MLYIIKYLFLHRFVLYLYAVQYLTKMILFYKELI